jgi:NDP-sugar pyrophosphorylase family protein
MKKGYLKEDFIVSCPYCKDPIIIKKIKCGIFRHGVYKNTGKQINPHSNEERCNYLVTSNKIWGCGKPFRIVVEKTEEKDVFIVIECDYI